jgi:hypothetical protein
VASFLKFVTKCHTVQFESFDTKYLDLVVVEINQIQVIDLINT